MVLIKTPQTREEFKAYYTLRYRILREPWSQARGTEKDDYEPISQHFMAVDEENGDVLGVIKIFEREPGVGWISHLAVNERHQKEGIGHLLVETAEEAARQLGFKVIGAMSRTNTTEYFEQLGYRITGIPVTYFSLTQVVWMEKPL